jgi:hypothetical protein
MSLAIEAMCGNAMMNESPVRILRIKENFVFFSNHASDPVFLRWSIESNPIARATTNGVRTYPTKCRPKACAWFRVRTEIPKLIQMAINATRVGRKEAFEDFLATKAPQTFYKNHSTHPE